MNRLTLDRDSRTKLYIQLYKKLKRAILHKELPPDSQLPPVRELGHRLGVNPQTVVKAYELLAQEQLIFKKVGSGSFVSPNPGNSGPELGLSPHSVEYDFASATPSPQLFPVAEFKAILNHILDRDQGEAFSYQSSQGFFPLRQAMSCFLAERSIPVEPEDIHVVSGAQQAIDLITKILIDFEDELVVEEPTYGGALSAFRSRGATIKAIPVTADGIDFWQLENYLQTHEPRLVYVMPSFQNPTGICWSISSKERLLSLASQHDFYIVEDDCLSELNYQQTRPLPIRALDASGRVIYIKSFSKIFMPGLRLAFVVLPPQFKADISRAKLATDISGFSLAQRAFDLFLREGSWHKQLEEINHLFAARFTQMKTGLCLLPPEIIREHPTGGLYFWLRLPRGANSSHLRTMAMAKGVAITSGNAFSTNANPSPYFRLSFAAVSQEHINPGLQRLAKTCQEFLNNQ